MATPTDSSHNTHRNVPATQVHPIRNHVISRSHSTPNVVRIPSHNASTLVRDLLLSSTDHHRTEATPASPA